MRKLSLETLVVESFDTTPRHSPQRGTVRANEDTMDWATCEPKASCYVTCNGTCGNLTCGWTCWNSCGTCPGNTVDPVPGTGPGGGEAGTTGGGGSPFSDALVTCNPVQMTCNGLCGQNES